MPKQSPDLNEKITTAKKHRFAMKSPSSLSFSIILDVSLLS